jgi:signal peptidase II
MNAKSTSSAIKGLRSLGLTLILGVLALDQASKYWVVNILRLPEIGQIDLSSLFDLTMVRNYGVSFGAFTADADWERWALVGLSVVIASIFSVWLTRAVRRQTILALALVIGGAMGNAIDRIRFGYVVDFFDISAMHFPWVFNVADSAITLGAILLALDMLLNPDETPQSRQKDVVNPDDPSTTA